MANRKTNYSKPASKSNGLKYQVRFDFNSKGFVVMRGKKRFGTSLFKNVDLAIEAIQTGKIVE